MDYTTYTMFDWYLLCIMAKSVMLVLFCQAFAYNSHVAMSLVCYVSLECACMSVALTCHVSACSCHGWMWLMLPKCSPKGSSCHDTRTWTYTKTNHHKLDIFPSYIKNTCNMYEKCTRVKSVSKRAKDV